ncbi:hypothetical protein [Kiloniella sp. b19]|uniref:hypothetical protein n=1 Tax=Kiloniella sp. GXU_MW_B19 TaxID=3141326 RepID=UPI0031E09FFD
MIFYRFKSTFYENPLRGAETTLSARKPGNTNPIRTLFAVFVLLCLQASVLPVHACENSECQEQKNTFRIGYVEGSLLLQELLPLLDRAYRQIGITPVFQPHPANRSLKSADHGLLDAEAGRSSALPEEYTHLVRVDVPLHHFRGYAYTNRADITAFDPEELHRYRVGQVRGILWTDKLLKELETLEVSSSPELVRILGKNWVDIIFMAEKTMKMLEQEQALESINIKKLNPPAKEQSVYHYIHKKHEDLVPELEKALAEILQTRE